MTVSLVQIFKAAAEKAALDSTEKPGTATVGSTTQQEGARPKNAAGTISLQELLQLHGEASSAVVLMLLALFSTLPITGVGTIISLAIFALAWRWARHVETTTVHGRIGNIRLSALWTGRCLNFLAWLYTQADRWLDPRLSALSARGTRPWWALWICLMGAVIFLPIPLGNFLPSCSLVVLSLAWMFRDGLALLVSIALGIAALVFTAYFGQMAWQMVVQSAQWVMGL